MVLRAVKVLIQAALLVQVLQVTGSVKGVQVNENFQNTPLSANDASATVKPANIPASVDKNAQEGEERGFWSWITGNDDDKSKSGSTTSETPATDSGASLATTTPIPGTEYVRPSYSSMVSQFGSLKDDFEKGAGKTSSASAGADSSTGAGDDDSGSAAPAPKTKKTKKPVAAAASSSASAEASTSASGSEAPAPKPKRKTKKPVAATTSSSESASSSGSEAPAPKPKRKTKKPVAATTSSSESASSSGSEAAAPKPKRTTKKTKKPVVAADSESGSEASGSDLDDLLGSDASGSSLDDLLNDSASGESLDDLLGSSAGSGSEDMSDLLDMSGSGGLDLGALGSMSGSLSFDKFMEMFGSGSSAIDLFGDPTQPQNNTVEDKDIILGPLYGGKEHGTAFSDIKNIKFQQMILNITMRGGERLDRVGIMIFTQEAVGNLVHGGKGGVEKFIEPEMGDTVTKIEIHWEKNKGKTCIFYLSMTTSAKKSLSVGTKTANSIILTPPEGYQFAGFHGRYSSSAIFCLGAIWTRTAATDLAVTDVMALPADAAEDVYNYETTIRNWVGPLETAADSACYQKKFDTSSKGLCPSGYNKDDDKCVTQCPLNYPIDCLMECIPQNADCTQEIVSKIAATAAVALNAATLGVFGTLVSAYKVANFALTCAINVVNAVKSIIYYLRYKQGLVRTSDTDKLMDKAFQLQIVILDLPLAIAACLGKTIPNKIQFPATILAVVSAIVMMAIMVGEALFASSDNVMLMLRESGALNSTAALDSSTMDLNTFLNTKNGTCGYEMKTLTNRVMGKVYEIRNNTPNAAANDVRVEVSQSSIIKTDIPVVTNHCMGQIWTNKTGASSYTTRNMLRKQLGVIVDQIIEDGTTDMGKNVAKKEKALEYANLGLFMLSMFDPTGIAWMASEFIQPICGPSEYLGEIDDGTLYDALGLTTVDQAFLGSYGIWKKKGDGSVTIFFESVDSEDVEVVIKSGGDKLASVKVKAGVKVKWTSTIKELGDKTLYLDRWRPGLFGLPGSGGGSLLMWIPHSSEGGHLVLHARLNVS